MANKRGQLSLAFEAKALKEDKIGDLDLSGVVIQNNFYPIESLKSAHISYLTQQINNESMIEVSDEIFDDLL